MGKESKAKLVDHMSQLAALWLAMLGGVWRGVAGELQSLLSIWCWHRCQKPVDKLDMLGNSCDNWVRQIPKWKTDCKCPLAATPGDWWGFVPCTEYTLSQKMDRWCRVIYTFLFRAPPFRQVLIYTVNYSLMKINIRLILNNCVRKMYKGLTTFLKLNINSGNLTLCMQKGMPWHLYRGLNLKIMVDLLWP